MVIGLKLILPDAAKKYSISENEIQIKITLEGLGSTHLEGLGRDLEGLGRTPRGLGKDSGPGSAL